MKRKDVEDVDRAFSSVSLPSSPRKSEFKPPTSSQSPSPNISCQNLYNTKRKGLHDFPSSSSSRKSRRFGQQIFCPLRMKITRVQTPKEDQEADILQTVAVPSANSSEGVIVLYNPRSQPSSIDSTNNTIGWESVKLTKEEEAAMEGSSESSNNCEDVVPGVPTHTFTSPETQKEIISEAEAKTAMVDSSASNSMDCGRVILQSGRTITEGGVGLEHWHPHGGPPSFRQS